MRHARTYNMSTDFILRPYALPQGELRQPKAANRGFVADPHMSGTGLGDVTDNRSIVAALSEPLLNGDPRKPGGAFTHFRRTRPKMAPEPTFRT
jgi:hypothetical protein